MAKRSTHSEQVHGGKDVLRASTIGSASIATGFAEETAIQLRNELGAASLARATGDGAARCSCSTQAW